MKQNNPEQLYHIAIAADNNFAIPLGVCCFSILNHAPKHIRYHIHILGDAINAQVLQQIQELCKSRNHRCTYHDVREALNNVLSTTNFPCVAFARFLLPSLLDTNIDRVFYTDADAIICDDISPLFEMDLKDYFLAATQDIFTATDLNGASNQYIPLFQMFNIDEEDFTYFISGQLLFNLPKWRESKLGERIIRKAQEPGLKLAMPDQDLMNVYCHGKIQLLNLRYGIIPIKSYAYELIEAGTFGEHLLRYPDLEVGLAYRKPAILHYATHRKVFILDPPQLNHARLFYNEWRQSPWRSQIPFYPYWLKQRGVVRDSWYSHIILLFMNLLLHIPYGYEMYWFIMNLFPKSLWTAFEKMSRTITRNLKAILQK